MSNISSLLSNSDSSELQEIHGPGQQITGVNQKTLLRPVFLESNFLNISPIQRSELPPQSGNQWDKKRPDFFVNGMLQRNLMSHAPLRPRVHSDSSFESIPNTFNSPTLINTPPLLMSTPPLLYLGDPSPRSSISSLSSLSSSSISPRLMFDGDGIPYLIPTPVPRFDDLIPPEYMPSLIELENESNVENLLRAPRLKPSLLGEQLQMEIIPRSSVPKRLSQVPKLTLQIPESRINSHPNSSTLSDIGSSIYDFELIAVSPMVSASHRSPKSALLTAPTRKVKFFKTVSVARTWSPDDYDRSPIKVEPFSNSELLSLSSPLVLHYLLEKEQVNNHVDTKLSSPPPTISFLPFELPSEPLLSISPVSLPPTISISALDRFKINASPAIDEINGNHANVLTSNSTVKFDSNSNMNSPQNLNFGFSPLISPPPTISPSAIDRYNFTARGYNHPPDLPPPFFSASSSQIQPIKIDEGFSDQNRTIIAQNSKNLETINQLKPEHYSYSHSTRITHSSTSRPSPQSLSNKAFLALQAPPLEKKERFLTYQSAIIPGNKKNSSPTIKSPTFATFKLFELNEFQDNSELNLIPIRSHLNQVNSVDTAINLKVKSPTSPISYESQDEDEEGNAGNHQRRRRRRKRNRNRRRKQVDGNGSNLIGGNSNSISPEAKMPGLFSNFSA
ncbi:hypothetical protein HK096_003597 [Nowakowskiella sp. JEL0078]|nr:hypothetical protein HK096_003597 [Nowakowskiella sp. JEL0078]